MVDATVQLVTSYDNRDRLKTKVTPQGTLNNTYDAHSNVLTIASSNTNGASARIRMMGSTVSLRRRHRLVAQGRPETTNFNFDPAGNLLNFNAAEWGGNAYSVYER